MSSSALDLNQPRRPVKRPNPDIAIPSIELFVKKRRVEDESGHLPSLKKKEVVPSVGLHPLIHTSVYADFKSDDELSLLLMKYPSLLETGKWPDLVIKCRGKEWKVHRVVACLPSKVLSTIVDSGFLKIVETDFQASVQEGTTGVIDLSASEPDIVDCMIRFLYTNDYSYTEKAESVPVANTGFFHRIYSGETLVTNAKVYVLAEFLDLPALKKTAAEKFASHLAREGLSPGFTESLRIMYSETPESDRDLKDLALGYALQHAAGLLEREDFAAFCKDKESKEFTFEMLKATTEKSSKPVRARKGIRKYTYLSKLG
ncbi:uncharacterized protein PAC_06221 [Phialocephala subalpina]|uniref:BTB domain-containing protein n=1 Tax=Phialocephala subalpina TaxID=576137 RepID=A0A1L7WUC6_9HELO|nr:uncharacterized protein PAC_06221 [Phialocephala subalpina]